MRIRRIVFALTLCALLFASVPSAPAQNHLFQSTELADSKATFVLQFTTSTNGNADKIKIAFPPGTLTGTTPGIGTLVVAGRLLRLPASPSIDPGNPDALIIDPPATLNLKPGMSFEIPLYGLVNPTAGNHAATVTLLDASDNVVETLSPISFSTFDVAGGGGGGSGDITAVIAGTGLTGGATSGAATLSVAPGGITNSLLANNSVDSSKIVDGSIGSADVNTAQIQQRVSGNCTGGNAIRVVNQDGSVTCESTGGGGGGSGWGLTGNSGTNPATNFLGTTDNQGLAFRTNNAEKMRVDASGNVGIGTSAPTDKLTVQGSGPTGARVKSVDERAVFALDSTIGGQNRLYTLESGLFGTPGLFGIYDFTASQPRLTIDTGGNVGIGTASPVGHFHVKGDSPVRILGDVSTLSGSESVEFMARNSQFGTDTGGMRIQRDPVTGDVNTILLAAASGTPVSEKMRIGGNGNVTIGALPQFSDVRLFVRGIGNSGATASLYVQNTDGMGLFAVDDNGKIHIVSQFLLPSTTTHTCWNGETPVFCASAAEHVPTFDEGSGYPTQGELVTILPLAKNPYSDGHAPFAVAKSTNPCDENLLGFITDPKLGADGKKLNEHYLPLAIYGYFPAKITTENGPIKRGDPITSSSKPGYGMKATAACRIIGYALEDADKEGTIQVFAHLSEYAAPEFGRLRTEVTALRQENTELRQQFQTLLSQVEAMRTELAAIRPGANDLRVAQQRNQDVP